MSAKARVELDANLRKPGDVAILSYSGPLILEPLIYTPFTYQE
jgi:hypothetical protein